MPQQAQVAVENNFTKGLVTEATGLNFPEQAVTDTMDCIYDIDGSVYRRTGLDFEPNFTTKTIDRANKVIREYLWQNVAGDGNTTVRVVQIGSTPLFLRSRRNRHRFFWCSSHYRNANSCVRRTYS
jgi:hypothetical protein